MNARVRIFASFVVLALAASAMGEPADSVRTHPDDGEPATTFAPETTPVEGRSAEKVAAGSAENDPPAVDRRRDSPGRVLTLRQKRIFVLGLAEQEKQ
jgi:hypothetical protein